MARFLDELKRTHYCGQLRASDIGKEVVLWGWVATRRDHGGCVFVDLRDREGHVQIVFDAHGQREVSSNQIAFRAEDVEAAHTLAEQIRSEWVIGVRGVVVSRGENVNPRIATGDIEVHVVEATVFNRSETPPFEITDTLDTREDVRLEYRYLDLRRAPLQRKLRMRHTLNQTTRNYLTQEGCLELETPFMVKYTPGGARNFLVPSRLNRGKFFALAESPQLFKQLFMVAGFDRYFQIVKCFRDEDLRLDRQPEFTQIDIELSFVNQDDVFRLVEGLVFAIWKEALGIDLQSLFPTGRFPQMPFEESMRLYGNDKPDLRFGLPHIDLTDIVIEHQGGGVPWWTEIAKRFREGAYRRDLPPEIVKCLVIPASANLSRADAEKLEEFVKGMGSTGLARAKVGDGGTWVQSPLAKMVTPEMRQAIHEATGAKPGDLLCFQFGKTSLVQTVMANLRVHIAKKLKLIPEHGHGEKWRFLWVINPPLFEYDDEKKTWAAAHHAFTRPHDAHVDLLDKDPGKVLCYRYDLVLNGFEIGGGSIRLHDPQVQSKVFRTLGISDQEAQEKFGFLLQALRFGAPPHGGIALGMDRIAMLVSGAESLRDVIPYPKSQKGTDWMMGAPSAVSIEQLLELGIQVNADEKLASSRASQRRSWGKETIRTAKNPGRLLFVRSFSFASLSVLSLALAVSAVGCPCVRGPVNASESLRWWLFSNFGASKICPEMLKRGVPIKLALLGSNSMGRFFPQQCHVAVNDADHSMVVQATGAGYAFLPITRRVGFSCSLAVEYRPDFRLESDSTYVWGRFSRMITPPELRILGVENRVVDLATKTPLGDVATVLGEGVVSSEIGKGFTVVRSDDGDDFTLGILNPPQKPGRALVTSSDHIALASDSTEVHASSRDYLGPLEIPKSNQALFVKLHVTGAPTSIYVVDKGAGDLWLQPYEAGQPLGPPPAAPLFSGTAPVGDSLFFAPLTRGVYYVVLENRAAAATLPLGLPFPIPESTSYVSYSVEVGDKP